MDRSNMQASLNNVSVTPTRYPRPRLRHTHSQCISSKKRTNHQFCHKRGNSLSLSRQKDYSSETELKVIEENIVTWGTVSNSKSNMNDCRTNRLMAYQCDYQKNSGVGYGMYITNTNFTDDDPILTYSPGKKNLSLTNNQVDTSGVMSSQPREHMVSRYIEFLSNCHSGSLDRNYIGDISLVNWKSGNNDSVFHLPPYNRFLLANTGLQMKAISCIAGRIIKILPLHIEKSLDFDGQVTSD